MVKNLTYKLFMKQFMLGPRPAVDLLIINEKGEVLLTKRNIPPGVGIWHLPGSFLLKGEKIEQAILRVINKELGLKTANFIHKETNMFENLDGDPRGHVIDLVCTLIVRNEFENLFPNEESMEIKYFKVIPSDIGFNHEKIIKKFK